MLWCLDDNLRRRRRGRPPFASTPHCRLGRFFRSRDDRLQQRDFLARRLGVRSAAWFIRRPRQRRERRIVSGRSGPSLRLRRRGWRRWWWQSIPLSRRRRLWKLRRRTHSRTLDRPLIHSRRGAHDRGTHDRSTHDLSTHDRSTLGGSPLGEAGTNRPFDSRRSELLTQERVRQRPTHLGQTIVERLDRGTLRHDDQAIGADL